MGPLLVIFVCALAFTMPSAKVLFDLLIRPSELASVIKLKTDLKKISKRNAQIRRDPHWDFCFEILNKVSRSFAAVIQQLGDDMRDAICVFYLVLRGLDTVEDDMKIEETEKKRLLLQFHDLMEGDNFTLPYGDGEYVRLMAHFDLVTKAYYDLDERFRVVIKDITKRMGLGMHEFWDKKVRSVEDYDKYCHYVAGLVGSGSAISICCKTISGRSLSRHLMR